MPIQARVAEMALGSLGQFRSKLLHPTKDRRAINIHTAFRQQVRHILIRQWVSQIHPNRTQ
ncbi:hypothetical protein AN189_18435, partial [Loktanella sp. 3ANDIMAR09]